MSDRLFALLAGAFLGWGIASLAFHDCREDLTECRANATCQESALAAYTESLTWGLYNADEVP